MEIKKCYENSCNDRKKENLLENNKVGGVKKIYPPDRSEIGRAAWMILHTISANYPNNPTENEKKKHLNFFYSFSNLYPCHICKLDLLDILKKYKLTCANKIEFSTFIFNLHNMINEEIGKDIYISDNIQNIIDKYKTSD
ncbi:FAD-linked sulfhydryl oxidase ERV1, putative [Plasmodium berghei]|uniref:Sulfhydryl oxidase n=2 Tax=Plasmodium berghei TaxID=5821 RepID=A0A509AEK4_PLABA|nr:FAD-linked sulfhydryl oxidase ERV1, putative [Plasmodium berghei ANKA]CXH86097.1 FAD-linked sulfhydryl oxidase ERV1, putative [Plasmodium berghei]SCL89946.1 FAD-linked sulfhydryl oxidase ERV1, putative [Plasmodium berghei]SCM15184.1 FAD-linked sulfhydryl oxidase ERV1, putative [Plasmodium berghei]SCM16979.1 FAD-linked sulfhydryl oxidase ERV1, putative [Plasmodium berghei]SCN21803.1 FAD-linked sulfhydryl oxidase ERV1, putative [Plasmodium berghei]|eukprot:XP_034419760.1 FAD-linked sulfhydryl oxidase ERV1, putative [Plasmodium berghei ANKA]